MGKKFERLEEKIAREYEKKGFSFAKAHEIGRETAAKVYREKIAHKPK